MKRQKPSSTKLQKAPKKKKKPPQKAKLLNLKKRKNPQARASL